jgi:hypothetical protein
MAIKNLKSELSQLLNEVDITIKISDKWRYATVMLNSKGIEKIKNLWKNDLLRQKQFKSIVTSNSKKQN